MAKGKFKSRIEAEQPTFEEQFSNQLLRWRKDIVLFFEEALGARLTNQQKGACHLLRDMIMAKRRRSENKALGTEPIKYFGGLEQYTEEQLAAKFGISIQSGKGLGKDFWIAGLSAYWLICYADFEGLATAPTAKQLEDVYSSEVKKMLRDSPAQLRNHIEVTRDGIYLLDSGKRAHAFITKRTATVKGNVEEQAETLQGLHARYMCMLIDEASGLPDGCFKAIWETQTGYCNITILITNVTRNTGVAYRTHYDSKERTAWACLRWDAEESDLDDVTGHSGLSAQIERMANRYGKESNAYRIAVKGLPPRAEDDALLNLEWVEAARRRFDTIETDPELDPVVFGIDIGRGNDDSVIGIKTGVKFTCKAKSTPDTMVLADWLDMEMETYDPDQTIIDASGMGMTFVDVFRKYYKRQFMALDVSEGATSNARYFRKRDELWMQVREAFEKGHIAIDPDDEQLFFELLSIKVENNWEQPIKIISKKKLKSLGLASPNRADSLMHTFYFRNTTAKRMHEQKQDRWAAEFAKARNGQSNSWMVQ